MTSNLAERFQTLHEIVKAAKHNLAPGPWDYLMGATETETTMRRNRQALDSIAFRPRVLRDVRGVDPSSSLFGRRVRLPVMLAPIGSIESFTPGGGATAAVGSARVRRAADALVRVQSRPRGHRRRRRQLPHLPALRAR